MITLARSWLFLFLLLALVAEQSATAEVTLLKDLTAVIMLLELPCGEVIEAKMQTPNDHIATCEDGNRYRIFVNAEGRVVAHKQ